MNKPSRPSRKHPMLIIKITYILEIAFNYVTFIDFGTYFTAGKHLESAAQMAKELKQLEDSATMYEKAANILRLDSTVFMNIFLINIRIYREDGKGFPAAEALSKAAK